METGRLSPEATLLEAVSAVDERLPVPAVSAGSVSALPLVETQRAQRFVLFTIAGVHYAVGQQFVTELDRVPKTTLVPQVPAWIRGVANIRGDIISVVDLRLFLGIEPAAPHSGRLLVVRLPDEELTIGFVVDGIGQIVTVASEDIRPPASPLEGALAPFLAGVSVIGERLVAVVDLDRLLRSPEIRQFDEVKEDSPCEAH